MNSRILSSRSARMLRPIAAFALPLLPVLSIAAAASASRASHFADLTLEQLMEIRVEKVFSASKYEQKVTRAPASVTILTADEIERYGHRTLADVLRSVRGVYVTSDRNYANLGMRGFARPGDFNTRVLLLVDGHRMNDNLYSSALVGTEGMTDLALVERVEVIRGPSSSIYGNSAFFGVINVVTRKAADIDGTELAVERGSLDTTKSRVTYGRQLKYGIDLVLSASVSDSAGNKRLYYPEFDQPVHNNGVAEKADSERASNFHGRLDWRDFTLSAGYSEREKQVPTASFGTFFNDGREITTDIRAFAELKFERTFVNGLVLASRLSYDRYHYLADYPYNFAGPGKPPSVFVIDDKNHGKGANADIQLTHRIGTRHTVVVGAEHRRDLSLVQSSYNDDGSINFKSDHSDHSLGFFVQDEILLHRTVILNAGLRYDSFSNFGGKLSPRVGLIYNPAPQSTFKLLYGEAYRAPNAYESYLESPGYTKANLTLGPEAIRTLEAVYEHYLPRNHRLSVSAYHYDIESLLAQQFDPSDGRYVFRNGEKICANGVELEVEGRYVGGLLVRGSYAWQRAVFADSRAAINNSPRHLARINTIIPLIRELLHAGVEVQSTSSLQTISGTPSSGFTIVNATLFSNAVAKNLTLSASLYNLFDRKYAYPGSTGHRQDIIPQDGRTFRLRMAYKF